MYYSTKYSSPLGELLLVSDGEALCGVWYMDQKHYLSSIDGDVTENDDLAIFSDVKNGSMTIFVDSILM